MDYKYKSFPTNEWRIYKSWVVLKRLPKFQLENAGSFSIDCQNNNFSPFTGSRAVSALTPIDHERAKGGGINRDKTKKKLHSEEKSA